MNLVELLDVRITGDGLELVLDFCETDLKKVGVYVCNVCCGGEELMDDIFYVWRLFGGGMEGNVALFHTRARTNTPSAFPGDRRPAAREGHPLRGRQGMLCF